MALYGRSAAKPLTKEEAGREVCLAACRRRSSSDGLSFPGEVGKWEGTGAFPIDRRAFPVDVEKVLNPYKLGNRFRFKNGLFLVGDIVCQLFAH